MADALIPVGSIYEGFWIEWTRNRFLGCTLTLGPTYTTILTNSLAMWVTLCGMQLWTIIRYVLHQSCSPSQVEPRTPQLSGVQVILRNTGSALTTAYLMQSWARNTRSSTGHRSKRAYAIACSAAIYAVSFTIAGMFSNNAIMSPQVNGGSPVLLHNSNCGVWNETIYDIVENHNFNDVTGFGMMVQHLSKKSYELQLSQAYAQECYLSSQATLDVSSDCRTLRRSALPYTTSTTTSCPFATEVCLENTDNIVLDTGDLDSHEHFGINSMPTDRLTYRRVTECAVLNGTSYVGGWNGTFVNASEPRPASEASHVYFGQSLSRGTNWTYSYSNFVSFYDNFSVDVTTPYQLGVQQAYAPADPQWSFSQFEPIQELAQDFADVTLAFLSFTGMYLSPVDDPWFSAARIQDFNNPLTVLRERYTRNVAISTLGCKEQHNFCTNDGVCTGFLGFDQVQNIDVFNNAITSHQNATFDRLLRAIAQSNLYYIVRLLAASSAPLLASREVFGGNSGASISKAPPSDQWQRELHYWHSIAMAHLQRTVARWATAQIVEEPDYLLKASIPQDVWFCDSLVVPSRSHQSFSVVAIVGIVFIGCLIILVGFFVEWTAARCRKWLRKSTPGRHWNRDDMIELQRRKTVGTRSSAPTTDRSGISSIDTRSHPSQRATDLQTPIAIPSFRSNNSPRSTPLDDTFGCQVSTSTLSQPSGSHIRQTRDSWITISLCSINCDSRQNLAGSNISRDRRAGHVSACNRAVPGHDPHLYTTSNRIVVDARYPEWV